MKLNNIAIISIPVTDQAHAKAFYCDMLGFEVIADNPMGPGQQWVQLGLPNAQTSITLVTWFEKMPPGSVQGIVLDTDDIDSMHRLLTDRGVAIGPIDPMPWGRFAVFNDPDGNGWVLQAPTED